MKTENIKRIGFISTRISGADGVSLEIAKWARVLERNGFQCYYFSGENDRPGDVSRTCPEAHFSHPRVLDLQGRLFGGSQRPAAVTEEVHTLRVHLKKEIHAFIADYKLDLIIPENILAIPMHIPLGLAVTEVIAETGIPVIAHHHDFSWERDRFLQGAAGDFLAAAFPPVLPSMRHVVINSIGQEALALRRGVTSIVVPNVYDFASPPGIPSEATIATVRRYAGVSHGDPMILQPTRIVPRKWIERAVDLVAALKMKKPVLVLSHASGDEGDSYLEVLRGYAESRGVSLSMIADEVSEGGVKTSFSFADIYGSADLVTYPSGYEGFGNALLEAIFYRRPLLVNRYPVFIRDIEAMGFDLTLMDGFISHEVVEKINDILYNDTRWKEAVEHNFSIGEKYFSFEVLEKKLLSLIYGFEG